MTGLNGLDKADQDIQGGRGRQGSAVSADLCALRLSVSCPQGGAVILFTDLLPGPLPLVLKTGIK